MGNIKQNSTTELLFTEYLTSGNLAVLEQIYEYKKVATIYERTQYALGRKVSFKSNNSSTEKVKINIHGIGSTNQI